jgi:hypothetical protein
MRLTTINELARRRGACRTVIERRLQGLEPDATLIMGHRTPSPLFNLDRPEVARLLVPDSIATEPQVEL